LWIIPDQLKDAESKPNNLFSPAVVISGSPRAVPSDWGSDPTYKTAFRLPPISTHALLSSTAMSLQVHNGGSSFGYTITNVKIWKGKWISKEWLNKFNKYFASRFSNRFSSCSLWWQLPLGAQSHHTILLRPPTVPLPRATERLPHPTMHLLLL